MKGFFVLSVCVYGVYSCIVLFIFVFFCIGIDGSVICFLLYDFLFKHMKVIFVEAINSDVVLFISNINDNVNNKVNENVGKFVWRFGILYSALFSRDDERLIDRVVIAKQSFC